MITYSYMLALGGDLLNVAYQENHTVAEVGLMARLHGESSVKDLRPFANYDGENYNEMDHVDAMKRDYPFAEKEIDDLRARHGGKLPQDIEELRLSDAQFASGAAIEVDDARDDAE